VAVGNEKPERVQLRTKRALESAQKYSLVANSVKAEIIIAAQIVLVA
jgi:hypothetical protein